MLDPTTLIVVGLLAAGLLMAALWAIQRKTGNAGIVDVGWSAGVGMLGVLFAVASDGDPIRRLAVSVMIGFWSLRLAAYLFFTRVWRQPEEGRYVELREKWADRADRNLFFFFEAQAVLALLFALPVLVVAQNESPALSAWDFAGVAVWLFAFSNTVLADWQLHRFKSNPTNSGRTCRAGWWRYSRHPNYFFEWLHWWSYALLAIGSGWWWLPVAAPLVMLFFLLKVTGIPPTEAHALASRGEEYRDYQRTTSAFVPWFPKQGGAAQ